MTDSSARPACPSGHRRFSSSSSASSLSSSTTSSPSPSAHSSRSSCGPPDRHLGKLGSDGLFDPAARLMWLSDQQKLGVGLVSFGAFFLALGILLFFDAALLALGNVLFTGGICLLIGPQKTFYFFARRQKIRGTICFFTGIVLVFCRWTFIGMAIEAFGFLNLFGDFFPTILSFLRQVPFLGNLLLLPGVREVRTRLPCATCPFVKELPAEALLPRWLRTMSSTLAILTYFRHFYSFLFLSSLSGCMLLCPAASRAASLVLARGRAQLGRCWTNLPEPADRRYSDVSS